MKRRWVGNFLFWALAAVFLAAGMCACASKKGVSEPVRTAQPEAVAQAEDTGAQAPAPGVGKTITGIEIQGDEKGSRAVIQGNQPLVFTAVKSPFANGVVLYFPGAALGDVDRELAPEGDDFIEKVTCAQSAGEAVSSRVEIVLRQDVPFAVDQDGDNVVVSLGELPSPADMPVEAEASGAMAKVGEQAVETVVAEVEEEPTAAGARQQIEDILRGKEPAAQAVESATEVEVVATEQEAAAKPAAKPAGESARVRQVDFIQEQQGRSSIRVETTAPVDYKVRKLAERRLLIELPGVVIPREQQRALITTRFESAVDRIIPLQKADDQAAISVELRQLVPYRVQQDDDSITMHLEASTIPPRPMTEAGLPEWEIVLADAKGGPAKAAAEADQDAGVGSVLDSLGMDTEGRVGQPRKYYGEKITLDFQKADIKNVFQILKEVSGLNFAIDREVEGEVTLTMTEPVPWDQILHLVLRMNQLGAVRMGDIIRIAPQAVLDAEEQAVAERLEAEQRKREAEVMAEEAKKKQLPQRLEYVPINYAKCTELADQLRNIKATALTGITGEANQKFQNISCDERTNTIIIIDNDPNIEDAKAMVAQLDRPTPQVMIEARIVEANTTFSREIGINWNGKSGIQPTDTNVGVGPQRGFDALGGTYGYNWKVNHPNLDVADASTLGFNFTRILGLTPLTIDATLAAMESRGAIKIVSAPKILTLDNRMAKIKQGIEYPVKQFDDAGNTVINYKDVDLLLEVTPHVTRDRRVSMEIKTTKNDVGELIGSDISFNTKEAETELLVNDGDTVVIGGIIKTTKRDNLDGVPGLMRIPVVGWLFKATSTSDQREELLVFITPRIVDLDLRR